MVYIWYSQGAWNNFLLKILQKEIWLQCIYTIKVHTWTEEVRQRIV